MIHNTKEGKINMAHDYTKEELYRMETFYISCIYWTINVKYSRNAKFVHAAVTMTMRTQSRDDL